MSIQHSAALFFCCCKEVGWYWERGHFSRQRKRTWSWLVWEGRREFDAGRWLAVGARERCVAILQNIQCWMFEMQFHLDSPPLHRQTDVVFKADNVRHNTAWLCYRTHFLSLEGTRDDERRYWPLNQSAVNATGIRKTRCLARRTVANT